jgi:lysine 6-dehydrogenase
MRMLVLGAGLQGSACAYDLLQQPAVERVTLADLRLDRLPKFLRSGRARRLVGVKLNVKDSRALQKLMRNSDAVLCALPYYFNYNVARAAVRAGVHHADLGGNTELVLRQKEKLNRPAVRRGVSIVPDCGLAPGMVNILAAEGIRRVGDAESVKVFVGGLPQHPEPPLNYQIVYSLEGALDYYTTPSLILRDGRLTRVSPLSEIESVDFPEPVGRLEAFHTGGGISTMPLTHQGKIRTMEYKTLRYPGHAALMRSIRELGLLELDPVPVKGRKLVPRDAFIAIVSPKLLKPESGDLVALRVEVTARNGKRVAWQLLDRGDPAHGISAMMRTTGYSLSVTGLMQVDGRISRPGVMTPDEAVPFDDYVSELSRRGVRIEEV